MSVENTEYQQQYDQAAAELDAAAQATTAPADAPADEPAKVVDPAASATEPAQPDEADPLADIKARLEKAEKIAKDNQAAFTRAAQEAAQLRREREQERRAASKPAILDANPELADAIRYVASDPTQQHAAQDQREQFIATVDKAHPGIFSAEADPDLIKSLEVRLGALDESSRSDPLVVIREITAEKLAHAERQVGKRFAAESAKLAQKSAMSVPGAGAGSVASPPVDAALAEVQRIQNMSDADFQKEVRRVKGY